MSHRVTGALASGKAAQGRTSLHKKGLHKKKITLLGSSIRPFEGSVPEAWLSAISRARTSRASRTSLHKKGRAGLGVPLREVL